MSIAGPAPPKSMKWTGPPRSAILWRTASILRRGAEDGACQTHQDVCDRRRRPPAILVEAVEDLERGQRTDHVFRFFERTAGTELIGRRQPFGEGAVFERCWVAGGGDRGQGTKQGGIGRP